MKFICEFILFWVYRERGGGRGLDILRERER